MSRQSTPKDISGAPRPHRLALGIILLGAGLILGSQFEYEKAAMNQLIGLRLLGSLQSQQAISTFQGTVRAHPNEPEYYQDLGTAYLNLARYKFQSADPSYHPARNDITTLSPLLALTLGRDQLSQLAVYALEKASALDPLDPKYLDAVGNAYLRWHHPQPALLAFQRAESVSHQNPKYLAEEARALLQQGKAAQALAVSRSAVSLDSSYWYAHASTALAYHQLGQKSQAKSEAFQALYWEPLFWPPPLPAQVKQMKDLRQTG